MVKEKENRPQIDVNSEIKDIQDLDFQIKCKETELASLISEKNSEINGLREERDEKLNPLAQKIRKGELSSGDKITDFVAAWHADKKLEIEYKHLETDLKNHQGQFVLFKEIKEERHVFHKPPDEEKPSDYNWDRYFNLAIIGKTPLKFDVYNGTISMGGKTAIFKAKTGTNELYNPETAESTSLITKIEEYKDEIDIGSKQFENLNKPFETRFLGIDNPVRCKSLKYELIIGDNEIYKYLWHNQKIDCIILPVIAETLEKKGDKIWPPALEQTLFTLKQITLNNIRKTLIERPIIMCPSEDDRLNIDKKMVKLIKEAIQYKMHKNPWIYKTIVEGESTEEINVPIFIQHLAENYSINIPDYPSVANLSKY